MSSPSITHDNSRNGSGSEYHQLVLQNCGIPVDAIKQSRWADIPPELLRDVVMRLETSDTSLPSSENVLAGAGVCKNWRKNLKELVKAPQLSPKLTVPISVKQPAPEGAIVRCYVKRNPKTQSYYLYQGSNQYPSDDDGKFLLAARKYRRFTCNDYIISSNCDDISKGSSTYVGMLRSNYMCSKYTVCDAQINAGSEPKQSSSARHVNMKQVCPKAPAGYNPVAHVSYALNLLGPRGPRKMKCIMAAAADPTHDVKLAASPSPSNGMRYPFCTTMENNLQVSRKQDGMLVLQNKPPKWHEQLKWCLNFRGRVTVPSVKNFQIVGPAEIGEDKKEYEDVLIQFGRVGRDMFTMDYQFPISAFQAFAICLSCFGIKPACE